MAKVEDFLHEIRKSDCFHHGITRVIAQELVMQDPSKFVVRKSTTRNNALVVTIQGVGGLCHYLYHVNEAGKICVIQRHGTVSLFDIEQFIHHCQQHYKKQPRKYKTIFESYVKLRIPGLLSDKQIRKEKKEYMELCERLTAEEDFKGYPGRRHWTPGR